MYFTINMSAHGIPLTITGEWKPAEFDASAFLEVLTVHQGETPIIFEKDAFIKEYGDEIKKHCFFRYRGGR